MQTKKVLVLPFKIIAWIVAIIFVSVILFGVTDYIKWGSYKSMYGTLSSAERGDREAEKRLIIKYFDKSLTPQEEDAVVKWMRAKADQNDANAQFYLGTAYFSGIGVKKDNVEAVKWLRKAADKNVVLAQINLAGAYYRGDGVPKDIVLADMWFNLATKNGDM